MQHPTTPGGENEPVFTSFLFLGAGCAGGCFKTKQIRHPQDFSADLLIQLFSPPTPAVVCVTLRLS
jgi:hypothetical protein